MGDSAHLGPTSARTYVREMLPAMNARARAILWLDGGAGGVVGVLVLALHGLLAELYALPVGLVLFFGATNLLYASYSGTLARRASRGVAPSRVAIDVLIVGNLAWTCACAAFLVSMADVASVFGVAQIAAEGIFCAALAIAEHRFVRPLTA